MNILEKANSQNLKSESDQNKLTFNTAYYPVFQNILLTPGKEHKKVFEDIPVVGFRNGKSLKDDFVRTKLPNGEITGRYESCGKGNCQVCNFICDTDSFSTKACCETLKIHKGELNCNS